MVATMHWRTDIIETKNPIRVGRDFSAREWLISYEKKPAMLKPVKNRAIPMRKILWLLMWLCWGAQPAVLAFMAPCILCLNPSIRS